MKKVIVLLGTLFFQKLSNFAPMFFKRISKLLAVLLTMATLMQSSESIGELLNLKLVQNVSLDFDGDHEEQDIEKEKDKIKSGAAQTANYFDFTAEKLEHQVLFKYINFIEIPFPPPDFW
jgi:hypothetical protein